MIFELKYHCLSPTQRAGPRCSHFWGRCMCLFHWPTVRAMCLR